MNIRTFITIIFMAGTFSAASAQDVKEKINEIKLDPQYIYGEASHENADSAFNIALRDLKMHLEASLRTTVELSKLKKCAQKLSRSRGQRVKVLAYVRAEDFTGSAPTPPAPPVQNTVAQSQPEIQQQPQVENETQPQPEIAQNVAPNIASLARELMETEHLQEALLVLEAHKKRGMLSMFAPYSKASRPQIMYLLIFDPEYNIPLAVLAPEKPDGKRDNIVNNSDDSLSNYSDKVAVCFSF